MKRSRSTRQVMKSYGKGDHLTNREIDQLIASAQMGADSSFDLSAGKGCELYFSTLLVNLRSIKHYRERMGFEHV